MNTEKLNNNLRLMGIITLVLLSVFLFSKTVNEFLMYPVFSGTPVDMSRVITVSGHSEIEATPDIASFSWDVTVTGKTVEEAQNKAAEKSNKAIAYLKDNGIPASDISNQSYNTSEIYDYKSPCTTVPVMDSPSSGVSAGPDRMISVPSSSCPKIVGYTTNQSVIVKIRDVKEGDNKIGKLIAGVGQYGVKASSAYFTFDDPEGLKQQARIEAVEKARTQAEEIASALGVKLKGVVSFNESYGGYPMAISYARDSMMSEKGAPIAPQIPNGNQTISADVTVTYSIR